MNKKIILFSTRFIEREGMLFNENNKGEYCKSEGFLKFFLGEKPEDIPESLVKYLNRNKLVHFFIEFCKTHNLHNSDDTPLVNENDDIDIINDKLWGKFEKVIPGGYKKWKAFFQKFKTSKKLLIINESNDGFPFKIDEIKDIQFQDVLKEIVKNAATKKDDIKYILNTDFREAKEEQRTLDRRFKIYKLETKENDDTIAFGVWCLKDCTKDKYAWYKALYSEIEKQLKEEFKKVRDVYFFLHDEDISPSTTFEVVDYERENKEKGFDFLGEGKKLSVAVFQHSLDPIAKLLSQRDIDKALAQSIEEMKDGAILGKLYALSDILASWQSIGEGVGKNEFIRIAEELKKVLNYKRGDIEELVWPSGFDLISTVVSDSNTNIDLINLNREINERISEYLK